VQVWRKRNLVWTQVFLIVKKIKQSMIDLHLNRHICEELVSWSHLEQVVVEIKNFEISQIFDILFVQKIISDFDYFVVEVNMPVDELIKLSF